MATLIIKKVGNHWYIDVPHDRDVDISLPRKTELYLNKIQSRYMVSEVLFDIEEVPFFDEVDNLIIFNEDDITRYFITDDEFLLKFSINSKNFEINSNLYFYITHFLDLNFHSNLYKITLHVD